MNETSDPPFIGCSVALLAIAALSEAVRRRPDLHRCVRRQLQAAAAAAAPGRRRARRQPASRGSRRTCRSRAEPGAAERARAARARFHYLDAIHLARAPPARRSRPLAEKRLDVERGPRQRRARRLAELKPLPRARSAIDFSVSALRVAAAAPVFPAAAANTTRDARAIPKS